MTDLTAEQTALAASLAKTLVEDAYLCDGTKATGHLPDGRLVRVKVWYDTDTDLFEYESMGTIHYANHHGERPVVEGRTLLDIDTRQGPVYWDPPEDYEADGPTAWMLNRVRGYYGEDWGYVGLTLSVGAWDASIGGIESDTDEGHITELVTDLLSDAISVPESAICPTCRQTLPTNEECK